VKVVFFLKSRQRLRSLVKTVFTRTFGNTNREIILE
jgi:hypothetical protein